MSGRHAVGSMSQRAEEPARHGAPVVLDDVVKAYRTGAGEPLAAADHVSLSIDPGAAVALTGPSGSGKSTLLHLIGGIDAVDSGTITVSGTEVSRLSGRQLAAYRRTVGFVFQRYHLLPALSALDNVLAPVLPLKTSFDKRGRAQDLLEMVGLADRAKDLPSRLSGGQQQRVAIARALINDPPIVLADEPTGNLDSRTGTEIVELLLRLRAERGTTLLLATHDLTLAARCERVVRLRDGQVIGDDAIAPVDHHEVLDRMNRLA